MGYQELISRDLAHAEYLRAQISSAPDLELLAGELSIACFRYVPAHRLSEPELDALNGKLIRSVQLGGRSFVAGTTVRGKTALRACIVNPGTRRADLDVLVAEARTQGARLCGLT